MLITVKVEERHVAGGCRVSPWNCPVARAVAEHVAENVLVAVTGESIAFYPPEARDPDGSQRTAVTAHHRVATPGLRRIVVEFDNHAFMEPFSFDVEVPDELLRPAADFVLPTPQPTEYREPVRTEPNRREVSENR